MSRNRTKAAPLLALLPAAAFMQFSSAAPARAASAPAAGVLLKYKYSPGEVLRFRMTENINSAVKMGAHSMPIVSQATSEITQMVKSVNPVNGNATILVRTSPPMMTMNGRAIKMPMSGMGMGVTTMVIAPTGKPVSMSMGGLSSSMLSGSGSMPPGLFSGSFGELSAFPDHAVRIGDIWRSAFGMGQAGLQMYIKQSLVGLSASGGHSLANIASRYTMNMSPNAPMAGMRFSSVATGTGHELFDMSAGTLNSSTMTMVMTMKTKMPSFMAGSGAFNTRTLMTMRMERIGS